MELTGGCYLLFPDGSCSPDQGGCASRDAVGVGGFWWGGGLVSAVGVDGLLSGTAAFFPHWGQKPSQYNEAKVDRDLVLSFRFYNQSNRRNSIFPRVGIT